MSAIDDKELAAINTALAALLPLGNDISWKRALTYIIGRLEENCRRLYLNDLNEFLEPSFFVTPGDTYDHYASAEDAIRENGGDLLKVIEVCRYGVVSQQFGVCVPVDDGGDEIELFSTREAAETYLAAILHAPAEDQIDG